MPNGEQVLSFIQRSLSIITRATSAFVSSSWQNRAFFIFYLVSLVAGIAVSASGIKQVLSQKRCPEESSQVTASDQFTPPKIVVDVSGAVERPGIVELESGQRLADAIAVAGGIQATADFAFVSQQLNLAQELHDQDKVHIPFFRTSTASQSSSDGQSTAATEPVVTSSNSLISLNNATMEELMQLDGVGEKRAEAIIQNRPFAVLRDVVDTGAITEGVFESIEDAISL